MTHLEEQDYSSRFDRSLWLKLFRMISAQKKQLWSLVFVMITVAGIDVFFPLMNKYVVDAYIKQHTTTGLLRFIVPYGILTIIQTINVFLLIHLAGRINTNVCYTIRNRAFEQLQRLSFSYYDKTPVGWMMSRLTSDCEKLSDIVSWGLTDIVWGSMVMIGISIAMICLDAKLALLTLSVLPPLLLTSLWFQKRILKGQREVRKINSKITAAFNEGIMGAKTTKTLVREEAHYRHFSTLTSGMRVSSIRCALLTSIFLPMILLFGSIGTAIALIKGGVLVNAHLI
ncbi:MAG: hypothetical protein JW795_04360, partial [Chitinivibrionales bacterium]|nr:hypothetical protein [Chitinivibrionales bacterium]